MSFIQISKRKDIIFNYHEGYDSIEVLKDACTEARFYRCSLLPGNSVKPELFSTLEHTQIFLFMEGDGYVVTPRKGFNIDDKFAVFVPDYDSEPFEIVCASDSKKPLEYIHIITEVLFMDAQVWKK